LTFVSATSGCTCDGPTRVVTCNFGAIQKPLTVGKTVTVTGTTPGQINNTASKSIAVGAGATSC
jgi:hypothetical protein